MSNPNPILGALSKFAQAGISTFAQAQARQAAAPKKKKGGCTPCAAKANVVAVRQRIAQGKL